MRINSKEDLEVFDWLCKYHQLYLSSMTEPDRLGVFFKVMEQMPEIYSIFINDWETRSTRREEVWRIGASRDERTKLRLEVAQAAPPPKKIEISGCMIVKNEAADILRAVASLCEICDEILVVDTGSTDGTQDIIKDVPKVRLITKEIHPWNFSTARNYSLKQCKGKTALVLDGDEEIMDPAGVLRRAMLDMPIQQIGTGYISQMKSGDGKNWLETGWLTQPRVFPLDGNQRYKGEVHNQPITQGYNVELMDLVLLHWNHAKSDKDKARTKRSLTFIKAIEKEIAAVDYSNASEEFKVVDAFNKYYLLTKLNAQVGRFAPATASAGTAYTLYLQLGQEDQYRHLDFLLLGAGLMRVTNNIELIPQYASKHKSIAGPCADNAYYGFVFFQFMEDPVQALEYGELYLRYTEIDRMRPVWHQETLEFYDDVLLRVELIKFWMRNESPIEKPDRSLLI